MTIEACSVRPGRGVSMLEIGMLDGDLERKLRDPSQRDATLNRIAKRVVFALRQGLEQGPSLKASCNRFRCHQRSLSTTSV